MRAQFEIGFADVDYARVLYFARYYDFVGRAFAAWLHARGWYFRDLHTQWQIATPIVESHCRYRGPLRLEDRCEVRLALTDLSPRGFRLAFHIVRLPDEARVAEGYTDHRFVDPTERRPAAPPSEFYRALEAMAAESAGHLATPPSA
ncbi:MAG TPA: thioesterase family protein [Chloroflexota bacterium]|nr:thioesterase family protein [Chloroflexota bacterium]